MQTQSRKDSVPQGLADRAFRRVFLEGLAALNQAGRLAFLGELAPLAEKRAFDAVLAPLRRCEWLICAKRPLAGPRAVLAHLSRYTHRVAISNSRLIRLDYRASPSNGRIIMPAARRLAKLGSSR